MFSEWVDDQNIDNYFDDLSFADVKQAPSSREYMNMRTTPHLMHMTNNEPEKEIGQIINVEKNKMAPTNRQESFYELEQPPSLEVAPNSIFIDKHPVGSQPKINILRSADRETYCNRSAHMSMDWIYNILVAIAFVMVLIMYINVKTQLCSMRTSFDMLMRLYCSKMHSTEV